MFSYKMPTEVLFGSGSSHKTGEMVKKLGGGKAIITTDNGVFDNGVLNNIETSLKEKGIPYKIFSEVEPEPTIQGVAKATEMLKSFNATIVIGVGGGSSIDTAKAVAVMGTNQGQIFDYVGFGLIGEEPLPIIAIPTTSGTGSEATFWSVLADKTNDIKASVGGWEIMPSMAILDPELTLTLPPRITATTGIDALCHAMESFVAKSTQPISEGMSIHAMKLIARSLRRAVTRGDDIKAREDMLMGSLLAAFAFNITRLGLAHALAIPFGAHFHIPHGTINAILLPWVMEFNVPAATDKYIEIAKIFGENIDGLTQIDAAFKAVEAIKKLNIDIGIKDGLKDWGVKEKDLEMIAQKAYKSDNVRANPRTSVLNDLIGISKKAMNGLK